LPKKKKKSWNCLATPTNITKNPIEEQWLKPSQGRQKRGDQRKAKRHTTQKAQKEGEN
jgi:hypothetical protein